MPSNKQEQCKESELVSDAPVVLSEGAAVALGNVLSRFVGPPKHESKPKGAGNKRPRPENKPIVLVQNEEAQKQLKESREEKKRVKELRQKRLKFESNARVIPDAATGAVLERKLLETATKGAVTLFNAVAKAKKATKESAQKQKKDQSVSRESFMNMMKAGVSKGTALQTGSKIHESNESESSSEDKAAKPTGSSAKWLNDNYLPSGGKRMQDWDKPDLPAESSDEEEASDADKSKDDVDIELEQDEEEGKDSEEDDSADGSEDEA